MAAKSNAVRKSVAFDDSEADQALLDAIGMELSQKQYGSFSELCKAALHQFLLSREPTQSVILFMQLEREIAQLQSQVTELKATAGQMTESRFAALEAQLVAIDSRCQVLESGGGLASDSAALAVPLAAQPAPSIPIDPVLSRLGPLLEDF